MRASHQVIADTLRHPVTVIKAASEQRYVLGVAFAAGPVEVRKGVDGRRDWMSAVEVEKAAWGFLTGPREIGIQHADGTTGVANVVESYVWRADPWQIVDTRGNVQVVKAGDWMLGAVLDEPAWRMFKAGLIEGWSVQGKARLRRPA